METALRWWWSIILAVPVTALGNQCVVDPLARYTTLGGDPERRMVDVSADTSEANFAMATFSGSVTMQQGDKHLFSPKLTYHRDDDHINTSGDTTFATPQFAVAGSDANYDLSTRIITIQDARYYLKAHNQAALGRAKAARFDLANNTSTFTDPTWSTCPRDTQTWSLKASSLTVDRNIARATARHATLRIKGVPIFYIPYFTFPTDDQRASGFLTPSAHLDEGSGLVVNIPYYWNIAPNQDATFALRPMTKRGVMLGAEYRYLGAQQRATLRGTLLPDDKHDAHRRRWSLRADYQYRINQDWHFDARFQQVSDLQYTEDFAHALSLYDKWYLERHATLNGRTDYGNWLVRAQDYVRASSSVAADSTPYARLPQLRYDYHWRHNDWRFAVGGEAVHFSKANAVDAWRLSLNGSAAYRWQADYGYVEPQISVNGAHYALSDGGRYSRLIPTASLDSKLIFERPLNLFGSQWTQTLEPRLFYLYTPYHDQSSVPNFDSSLRSQSWNWLFTRDRFIGGDRIGDANQLTTAVTTRLYAADDGQERLRLSLGQIQYFADRRVTLPGKPVRASGRSDLISEVSYQIDSHWRISGLSFWDMDTRQNRRSLIDVRYHLDPDRFAGFSHRYAENDYDQLSLYGIWRVNDRWRGFLRQDYSLRHHNYLNTLLGIEYNDCCWAWRILGKRYRDDPAAPKLRNALYLEFVLKGLGRLGNGSGSVLAHDISGYRPLAEERSF